MSAMDKYIEGYTSEADYCPKCRADTASYHADGSNKCSNCGYVFYLVEKKSETIMGTCRNCKHMTVKKLNEYKCAMKWIIGEDNLDEGCDRWEQKEKESEDEA